MDNQKYINVLVGSLDTPNETFLIGCLPLESSSNVNTSIILHIVDDILRQLGTKREIFALLLTDAALLGGQNIKGIIGYASLMHATCMAHLLHNRAIFELVLSLKILMTKVREIWRN